MIIFSENWDRNSWIFFFFFWYFFLNLFWAKLAIFYKNSKLFKKPPKKKRKNIQEKTFFYELIRRKKKIKKWFFSTNLKEEFLDRNSCFFFFFFWKYYLNPFWAQLAGFNKVTGSLKMTFRETWLEAAMDNCIARLAKKARRSIFVFNFETFIVNCAEARAGEETCGGNESEKNC